MVAGREERIIRAAGDIDCRVFILLLGERGLIEKQRRRLWVAGGPRQHVVLGR